MKYEITPSIKGWSKGEAEENLFFSPIKGEAYTDKFFTSSFILYTSDFFREVSVVGWALPRNKFFLSLQGLSRAMPTLRLIRSLYLSLFPFCFSRAHQLLKSHNFKGWLDGLSS